ncbi:hypothetical protein PG637_10020 [Riemerella anatipestifer]|nr:hypothetical protein [Riemerella anatipestifer]MDY3326002.1 hypothetical protein [Riemerella anatipestifer]MDY3352449.1 hypothetical protein [Riemerella anatipestifer]
MKKYSFFIIFLCTISCTPLIEDTYRGYIYMNKKPLVKVKVIEQNTNNYTFTNKEGYFVLKRENMNFVNNLIIEADKSKDTVELLRGGGIKNAYYCYLNKNVDTIDLHRERVLKNQIKYKSNLSYSLQFKSKK